MDFFGQQGKARTKTTVLVVYFVIAIVFIIVSVYGATHPPLEQRIRALDPDWDAKFTPVGVESRAV